MRKQLEIHSKERTRLMEGMRTKLQEHNLVQNYPESEKDMAMFFGISTQGLLLYCPCTKTWWYYTGKIWVKDNSGMWVRQCIKIFHELLKELGNGIKSPSFWKLVKQLEKRAFRNTIMSCQWWSKNVRIWRLNFVRKRRLVGVVFK